MQRIELLSAKLIREMLRPRFGREVLANGGKVKEKSGTVGGALTWLLPMANARASLPDHYKARCW